MIKPLLLNKNIANTTDLSLELVVPLQDAAKTCYKGPAGAARHHCRLILKNIKGSWEAILPNYEKLLLDAIDYDEGW